MPTLDPQELIREANAVYQDWQKPRGEGIAPSHQQSLNLLGYLAAAHIHYSVATMGHNWAEMGLAVGDIMRAAFEMGRASAE